VLKLAKSDQNSARGRFCQILGTPEVNQLNNHLSFIIKPHGMMSIVGDD